MSLLKLVALDEEDLEIVSAYVKDEVIKVDDFAFNALAKRFTLAINCFTWETKTGFLKHKYERRRSILHFDRVLSAQLHSIFWTKTDKVLEFLTISFSQDEGHACTIELLFSSDATIRLEVKIIEAKLTDNGSAWQTSYRPIHKT